MTTAKMSPLRRRMVEDMQIRGLEATTQTSYLRAIEAFSSFLGRSPDSATPAELRAWQLHMARTQVSIPVYNHRITVLRFFFSVTCGRDEMTRPLRFRRAPRKLPEVLSQDEVARLLDAAPGPGLKYRAAFSVAYGAGLRASEVVNLKLGDIDSERMLIRVEQSLPRT
jgi:site-specific recombinase XerD